MTTSTNEISCYSTHLLLKYAHKKHLKEIDRGITTSLEKLDNPQEWTDAATWTKLAHNIECALGEHEGILSEIAKEIFLHEVNAFIPFFFRIAPERLILKYVTKYVQKYSNKNLDITIDVINNHKWLATMRPIIPARYSRQMCDFNKGWTYATIAIKGLRNFKINEKTCAARENASACIYELEWTPRKSIIRKIKDIIFFEYRDRNAIIQHMEQNHQELQRQYQEILSIRDFYSHIMDSMGEGIIWLDAVGTITFTNNAFCKLLGLPENEVQGKRFESFLKEPSMVEIYSELCKKCRRNPLTPIETEFFFASRNDELRFGQTTIIWVTSSHYPPGFVISIRDITEKKKIEWQLTAAEIRYRSLYENSPAIIVAIDMNGSFIYANPAMTEQSGYTEEELKGMHFKELIAPQADFDVDRLITNLLNYPTRLQEVHFKAKDGIWKCIALNTYHIHDADGTLAGIAGIGVDVTETKRLNEQLIKSQRMDLLGQLAGGMAHDFGNILTSINGFSRLIAGKSTDEKIRSYAESIERSGLRAYDLVKNLLAFSRGDSRQSVIFDIVGIIKEVKDMMYGAIPKMVTILAELPDEPYLILGDPGKIHQSIVNLCVNARDAIGSRQGTITLRVKKAGDDNNLIHVQVEDTGSGIPPDIIEKIFDPFFSTKEKKEGTGLGLSVVYGIMKSHKGEIYVESHPGEGCIFTLEFPSAAIPSPQ